ncbi:MAG: metallophosphoesterase family protein [Patescibacteria group bacterium]|nr:metallophosphoesterase family protein [Patescibacteria group bacterium]
MKIAIMSDIHSNLQALEAVLEDIKKHEVDQIFCLGDIIGYGADPWDCLGLILVNQKITVKLQGNHEKLARMIVDKDESLKSTVNESAWLGIKHTYNQIGETKIKQFADWPELLTIPELGITLAHGAVSGDHPWKYVNEFCEAQEELSRSPTKICFLGHTHKPFFFGGKKKQMYCAPNHPRELSADDKYVINVGSVGQPRDGNRYAAYGILDINGSRKRYWLRRVGYDIESAALAIRTAEELSEHAAKRLMSGT